MALITIQYSLDHKFTPEEIANIIGGNWYQHDYLEITLPKYKKMRMKLGADGALLYQELKSVLRNEKHAISYPDDIEVLRKEFFTFIKSQKKIKEIIEYLLKNEFIFIENGYLFIPMIEASRQSEANRITQGKNAGKVSGAKSKFHSLLRKYKNLTTSLKIPPNSDYSNIDLKETRSLEEWNYLISELESEIQTLNGSSNGSSNRSSNGSPNGSRTIRVDKSREEKSREEKIRKENSSSTPLITLEENTTTHISEKEIKTTIDNLMRIVRNNISEDSLSGWGGMIRFVLQGKGNALLEDSTEPLPQLSKEKLEGWLKKYFGEIQFSEESKMFGRWLHEKYQKHKQQEKLKELEQSNSDDVTLMLNRIIPRSKRTAPDFSLTDKDFKNYKIWQDFFKAEYDTLKEDSEKKDFKVLLNDFRNELKICPGSYARTPWGFTRFLDHTDNPKNFDWCNNNIEPEKKEDFIPTVM